jgi:pentapeptide MXKDX repeat protein
MHDQDTYARTRSPADAGSTVGAAAGTAKDTAKDEARTVARTAKRETGAVAEEAKGQVRRLAYQALDEAGNRGRVQHDRLVERLRGWIDELEEMAGESKTPVRAAASDLADRGRRVADYLADRGPEGILSEVQAFARRRPLAFIAGAVAAGFAVGRLGKGAWKARSEDSDTMHGDTMHSDAMHSDAMDRDIVERDNSPAYEGSRHAAGVVQPVVTPPAVAEPVVTQPFTPTTAGAPPVVVAPVEPDPYATEHYGGSERR